MNLYYEVNDQQVGPIGKTELQSLVKAKKLNTKTMVWQEGMENWEELGVFVRNRQGKCVQKSTPADFVPTSVCSECGQAVAEENMIRFQESWVCAGCKPVFIQKVKEGVSVAGAGGSALAAGGSDPVGAASLAESWANTTDVPVHINRIPAMVIAICFILSS